MSKSPRLFVAAAVAVALVASLAVGCTTTTKPPVSPEVTKTTIVTIKPGTIEVGADTAFPPFEVKEGTQTVGFDVDLGKAMAEKMGVNWDVISTAWDGIIPGLNAGKYDVIMSAMTITPERKLQMDVTHPYIVSDQSIAVKKGSPIKEPADLKGKKVGVQVDTTGQFEAEKTLGKDYQDLKKYDDILLAFQDLKAGRIDAIVNDLPVSAYIIEKNYANEMEISKVIKTDETYGIWVKKGNDQLRTALNKALAEVIADGTYTTIYKKWFNREPDLQGLETTDTGTSTETTTP